MNRETRIRVFLDILTPRSLMYSNLDAPLRLEMRRELHLLHRRLRATIIVVTHDPDEAMWVCKWDMSHFFCFSCETGIAT